MSGQAVTTRGVLPILESVEGFTRAIVPQGNAVEAGFKSSRITCLSIANVHDLIDPSSSTLKFVPRDETWFPFSEVTTTRGLSDSTIHALACAKASGKNVLVVGAKAWDAAKLYHEISPRISMQESREVACLRSIAGFLDPKLPNARPLRIPHHTVSERGLAGEFDRPGEVSLAHTGTLVLDHVLDFKRTGLSLIEHTLRSGVAKFCKQGVSAEYPAKCRGVATIYPDELRFFTPERVAFLGDYVRVDV
jgi:magnesium chelatase family protein